MENEESGGASNELSDLLEVGTPRDEPSVQAAVIPEFRDTASEVGIGFQRFNDTIPERYFLPEVMGGGVAWFDFDGDLDMDLYATDGCTLWETLPAQTDHVNRMFRSDGSGSFTEIAAESGSADNRFGQGCAVGDFNADGFPDLYLANYGRNTLLANNGDGTFRDITQQSETGCEAWSTSVVWFDANADDLPDLYVVNYVNLTPSNHQVCTYGGIPGYCGPGQWDGVADVLYLNQGDGRFTPSPGREMPDSKFAKGLAVAVCDFNSDRRPEVYVANDMMPNFLLTSDGPAADGDPNFHNVADAAGCAVSSDGRNEASMGVACADFDNDGQVDIFLTHYFHHKNTLYRNLGSLLFEDASYRSRIAATSFDSLGFGTAAFDADLDGDEDLFIANGHVLGPLHQPNEMKPQLLQNDGHGRFDDISDRVGGYFHELCIGRGVGSGDYDDDGRVDLAINHLDRTLAVLHNETAGHRNFIGIDLMPKNRVYPVGAQVTITAGSLRRLVPIVAGGSYLSSGDPRIVVGLGDYDGPVDIDIMWPGGETTGYTGLQRNRYWRLREARSQPVSDQSVIRGAAK
ncbi:MAG: CRTAC1 family protein [Planctomycetaceae bacterium]